MRFALIECNSLQLYVSLQLSLTRLLYWNRVTFLTSLKCCKTYLCSEASSFHGRIILAVTCNITTANIFDRHVLNIEANIVTRQSFTQGFVVHLNRFNFSCYIDRGKCNHHAWLQNTRFHTANWYSTNACKQETTLIIIQLRECMPLWGKKPHLRQEFLARKSSSWAKACISGPYISCCWHTSSIPVNTYRRFCRHPEEADAEVCQLDELVAGCSPGLPGGWFRWHCHPYG